MSCEQAQQTSAGRRATEVDAIYQRIDHSGQYPSIPAAHRTHYKIKVAQPEPGKLHAAGKLDSDSRLRSDLRNAPPSKSVGGFVVFFLHMRQTTCHSTVMGSNGER